MTKSLSPYWHQGERGTLTLAVHGLEAVELLAARGYGIGKIASKLGVSRRTLLRLKDRQPAFVDALATGLEEGEARLLELLWEAAEEGCFKSREMLAKWKFGYRPTSTAHVVQADVRPIQVPLSDEELAKFIAAKRIEGKQNLS
jgi:predicted DNA-binding protein (UPF0251 family)